MQVEVVKATIEQKPVLANLLELYAYDFTEFCDFDIGDDGFYGYEVFGVLDDCPKGHKRYYMKKVL